MQALTAPPRDSLTTQQVTALLATPVLAVSAGCEVLNADLTVAADISPDLQSGTVERQMAANVHGTCSLKLSRELAWGVDLVRPYLTLTDRLTGTVARFNVGVFSLTTPDQVAGESPPTFEVQGYDRLYLLDREVGDAYYVAAGTDFLTAVRTAISDAGLSGVLLDGTASGKTLATAMSWPLVPTAAATTDSTSSDGTPATWLRIINDLLLAVNYRGIWADENGLFRSEPYADPSQRTPEWTFDADDVQTLVGVDRRISRDVWAVPNQWVFVNTNLAGDPPPEPTFGAGLYVVSNVDGTVNGTSTATTLQTSQNARGLVRSARYEYQASSQADLISLGNRRVAADLRVATTYQVRTAPFPLAGHVDVFTFNDTSGDGTAKVQASSWSFDLSGSDVTWTWGAV